MKAYEYNPNRYHASKQSGGFNKRIALYGPTIVQDEIGNEIESFDKLMDCWSKVITLKGSEIQTSQEQTKETARFILRYSKPLEAILNSHKTKLEVHYKSNVYDVKSAINDDEKNETFTLVAEVRK